MIEFDDLLACPNCGAKLDWKEERGIGSEEGRVDVYICSNAGCGDEIEIEYCYK